MPAKSWVMPPQAAVAAVPPCPNYKAPATPRDNKPMGFFTTSEARRMPGTGPGWHYRIRAGSGLPGPWKPGNPHEQRFDDPFTDLPDDDWEWRLGND